MQRQTHDGERRALTVAVSDYQNRTLKDLDFCRNDGKGISKVLDSQGYQIYGRKKLIGEVKFYENPFVCINVSWLK